MRGVVQVEDAFAGEWRGARTRRASASPDCDGEKAVMMVVVVLTYGRSAWCGPLLCVWMELWVLLMEMIVGDGGVVDAEWMRE